MHTLFFIIIFLAIKRPSHELETIIYTLDNSNLFPGIETQNLLNSIQTRFVGGGSNKLNVIEILIFYCSITSQLIDKKKELTLFHLYLNKTNQKLIYLISFQLEASLLTAPKGNSS